MYLNANKEITYNQRHTVKISLFYKIRISNKEERKNHKSPKRKQVVY